MKVFVFLKILILTLGYLRASSPCGPLLWGFSVEGFPITKEILEDQITETKIYPDITVFYLQWPKKPNASIASLQPSLNAIWQKGSLPCITWEPMTIDDGYEVAVLYHEILEGHYDEYIKKIANDLKGFLNAVIVRFAHEMNINRYHWGTTSLNYGPDSPSIYIKMFRHVVDIFRKEQATNVLWAFSPNADSVPNEDWNKVKNYYPGDQYVDIFGMDGYDWNLSAEVSALLKKTWISPFRSFEQVFTNLYHQLKGINSNKPIIVLETATVNRGERHKSQWIKEALQTAKKWNLVGIVWFQSKKEEDWRVNQSSYQYLPIILEGTSASHSWVKDQFNR